MKKELTDIVSSLKHYMQMEESSGIEEVALGSLFNSAKGDDVDSTGDVTLYKDKTETLTQINHQISNCRECDLCDTRRNTVPGEGNPDAALMFIGEAPGMDEDIQGRPFVGRAGQLLTKMINAINLKREDVYIANCLKCRPPKNRTPLPSEIIACRNFLTQQIDTVKPKIICCLGRPASQTILMTEAPISRMRGKFYDYRGIKTMPTFHPAYLLRTPAEKKFAWEDFKKIRDELQK